MKDVNANPDPVLPQFDDSFKAPDKTWRLPQVTRGFKDAYKLASLVRYTDFELQPVALRVFLKYFTYSDWANVQAVFENIHFYNSDIYHIRAYYGDVEGLDICATDPHSTSYLLGGNLHYPKMGFCDLSFGLGTFDSEQETISGISWVFKEIECEDLADYAGWQMSTLGTTVLHELLHYYRMRVGTTVLPVVDKDLVNRPGKAYGAYGAQELTRYDQKAAIENAENWAWFATELYWTDICGVEFKAPTNPKAGATLALLSLRRSTATCNVLGRVTRHDYPRKAMHELR